jgi:hypothetical protein
MVMGDTKMCDILCIAPLHHFCSPLKYSEIGPRQRQVIVYKVGMSYVRQLGLLVRMKYLKRRKIYQLELVWNLIMTPLKSASSTVNQRIVNCSSTNSWLFIKYQLTVHQLSVDCSSTISWLFINYQLTVHQLSVDCSSTSSSCSSTSSSCSSTSSSCLSTNCSSTVHYFAIFTHFIN